MCRESIEVELEIPQKKKKMLIEIERPDLNILPETRPAKIFFYKKEEPFSKYFKSEGKWKVLPSYSLRDPHLHANESGVNTCYFHLNTSNVKLSYLVVETNVGELLKALESIF